MRLASFLAAAAAAALFAPGAADAAKVPLPRVRYIDGLFDELDTELTTRVANPDLDKRVAAVYRQVLKETLAPSHNAAEDANVAAHAVFLLRKKSAPGALDSVLSEMLVTITAAVETRTTLERDGAEDKIMLFEQANPGANTKKARKQLTLADAALARAASDTDAQEHLLDIRSAGYALLKIGKFDHVAHPPKSCDLKPLQAGEYVRGRFTVQALPGQGSETIFFEANAADATPHRDVNGVIDSVGISIYYCSGDRDEYVELNLGLVGAGPTFNLAGRGGFAQVVNSLCCGIDAGSTATITAGGFTQGYLQGTFSFSSSGRGGTGEFRVYIDP